MDTIFNGLSGWGKVGLPGAYTQKARERVLKKFSPAEKTLIDGSSARAAQLALSRVGGLSEIKA